MSIIDHTWILNRAKSFIGQNVTGPVDFQVDYIMSPLSIVSRMTSDAFLSLWTNSVLVDLKKQVVDIYKE